MKYWPSGLLSLRFYSTKGNAPNVVSYVRRTAEELTGQSEVSLAQAEVREKRDELKIWRQKVADATSQHDELQQRLRHVYAIKTQLYQAQRRDLSALQSINTEEENLTSEEQSLGETLESLKLKERECFDSLGDAILASHEKERAQSERMKSYSRLGSILGAVVGFAGSNLFLRREVRKHQRQIVEKMKELENNLDIVLTSLNLETHESTLKPDGNQVREAMEEVSERQLKELLAIHEQFYAARGGVLDPQTITVASLGLFLVSYALCAVIATLSSR